MLWSNTIEHADIVDNFFKLRLVHLIDLMTADGLLVNCIQTNKVSCQAKVLLLRKF